MRIYNVYRCPRCKYFTRYSRIENPTTWGICDLDKSPMELNEKYDLLNAPPPCKDFEVGRPKQGREK